MTYTYRPDTVQIDIDGAPRALRLTLGALAEMEAAFGGEGFEGLAARLKAPSAGDLIIILEALLRGGGAPLSREALAASDLDLASAAAAIAAAFDGLGGKSADGPEAPGKRQPGETEEIAARKASRETPLSAR
ncbi:MAG: GTA-gp10 family protein [Pseudomonadota bacterium]